MPLVCPACGTVNPEGGRFCGNCAASLETAGPVAPAPPQAFAPPPSWATQPSPAPVAPQPQAAPPPQAWAQPQAAPPVQPWTPSGAPPPGWGQQPAGWPAGSVPPGYQAYQPAAAPARRRPVGLIVGGAAALLAVLVVGGVAASSILSKPASPPELPVLPTPAPSTAVVRPSPTPAASTRPVSTPAPVVTSRPVVIVTAPPVVDVTPGPEPSSEPTAQPTEGPAPSALPGGKVVSVANISMSVAAPWTVTETKDFAIHLSIPQKGIMSLVSGTLQDPTTAEAWLQTMLAENQKTDPNADYCKGGAPQAVNVPGGPPGMIAVMCYTLTPQGGQALKLMDVAIAGVDQAGTSLFVIDITATEANIKEVLNSADPLLSTITWKLYKD